MNIYIANLHFSVTEPEIQQLFELYGEVLSVNLILDKSSKKSKGYAFVELKHEEDGLKSIEELNEKEVRGRTIKVSQAKK